MTFILNNPEEDIDFDRVYIFPERFKNKKENL